MPFDGTQFVPPHVALLMKAREWLSNPDNWCRGDYFKDGRTCALGALLKFSGVTPQDRGERLTDEERAAYSVARASLEQACGISIGYFNDRNAHPTILALFDKAIAKSIGDANDACGQEVVILLDKAIANAV